MSAMGTTATTLMPALARKFVAVDSVESALQQARQVAGRTPRCSPSVVEPELRLRDGGRRLSALVDRRVNRLTPKGVAAASRPSTGLGSDALALRMGAGARSGGPTGRSGHEAGCVREPSQRCPEAPTHARLIEEHALGILGLSLVRRGRGSALHEAGVSTESKSGISGTESRLSAGRGDASRAPGLRLAVRTSGRRV